MLEVHHHHPHPLNLKRRLPTSLEELPLAPRYISSSTTPSLLHLRLCIVKVDGEEQTRMSRNNHGKSPKADQLKLNVSGKQTRARGGPSTRAVAPPQQEEEDGSSSSPSISPPSSCVSSDGEKSGRPEETTMVLAGCPQCLMYVMLSEEEPKCPRCKSSVLLDFQRDGGGGGGGGGGGKNRRS